MGKKMSPLLRKFRYFGKSVNISEQNVLQAGDRDWENLYRRRHQTDKIVRTTHGVNCTGSCSWRVHVKDGIVAWEHQQTDYPTTGPDMPEYEPRGCPRGASFSWYIYSPIRVRYPYVRGKLLKLWRDALSVTNDPVEAWRSIVEDEEKSKIYKRARGKGGLVRSSWNELNTLISASLIYTIQKYGPDRIFGFSPIPAMSMVSYASGGRFLSLLGAPLISFYDWYADLPPASPQIWGEQTDVPVSSDWYNSTYLIMWGSNVPQTRTPDAHFMVEARYRGTKTVAVSPDYAQYTKFADTWLPVKNGMDGAMAMAMTHVILKEFYVDQQIDFFNDYVKQFTDLPFLVTLKKKDDYYVSDKFLKASDIGMNDLKNAEWKPVLLDENTKKFVVPNGTIGHRWDGNANWNLDLNASDNGVNNIAPTLTLLGEEDDKLIVGFPHFNLGQNEIIKRGVPVKKIDKNGETLYVTTVFDLMMANCGVKRGDLPGDYPTSYDDLLPYTPGWQEKITGVDRHQVAQVAREFAQNAIDSKGRSMIIMGCGINQWYNGDMIYRAVINLVLLCACEGKNGGGWAHYVGQEKCRPLEGWGAIAMARDWGAPPRLQNGASFFYFVTEQYRYEEQNMNSLKSPLVDKARYHHPGDYNVLSARLGWLPSYPQFNQNSIKLFEQAKATSKEEAIQYVVDQAKMGKLQFAIEDPEDPVNYPRVLFVWRSNLITSSAKGHEYFLKHLLGSENAAIFSEQNELQTEEIGWVKQIPEGKLDLLIDYDFRMCGTGVYSDIILPAATWYEKYDLSTTDMHPFIHPFNPAITPPWEAKSDWDAFKNLAKIFSEMAEKYFPNPVKDIVATPLGHDSPAEIACVNGGVYDWKNGEHEPKPGFNFPSLTVVERDYTKIYDMYIALGPTVKEKLGAHGISFEAKEEYDKLKSTLGTAKQTKEYKDYPSLFTDRNVCEAILSLSSTTNGALAYRSWDSVEKKTGKSHKHISEGKKNVKHTFHDITAQPRNTLTTPIFSGIQTDERSYSCFTINIEELVPFRTLTGRQHFYVDHDLIHEFGEELPTFKAPLDVKAFYDQDRKPNEKGNEITLRYLTPHFKWSYHSTYYDTLPMMTLFRGGPTVWMNNKDAQSVGIVDNDWIEMYNRNGTVVARAVVSNRIPRGNAYMYHAQDRTINVPGSTTSNKRAGCHNSPTKINIKPTLMIGGYAQLSYGFNYYGPTGCNRDEAVVIRKLDRSEVKWLED